MHRTADPQGWWVTPQIEFLREIEHRLQILAWQQTKDGQRGIRAPKRLPLPGDKKTAAEIDKIGGGEGFETVEEMNEFFAGHPWMPKSA